MRANSRPYPLNLSFEWREINKDWQRVASGTTSTSKVMAWSYNIRAWICRCQICSDNLLMFSTHHEGNCDMMNIVYARDRKRETDHVYYSMLDPKWKCETHPRPEAGNRLAKG